jgi:hypothetical protein
MSHCRRAGFENVGLTERVGLVSNNTSCIRLYADITEAIEEFEDFSRSLVAHFPDLRGVDFPELFFDIDLGESKSAVGADGVIEVYQSARLGPGFNRCAAAVRAGNRNDFLSHLESIRLSTESA